MVVNPFENDQIAASYDTFYKTEFGKILDYCEKRKVDRLLAGKPRGKLLEIGSGTGHWTAFFSDLGYAITAIEPSSAMLAIARQKEIPFVHYQEISADAFFMTKPSSPPRKFLIKAKRELYEHRNHLDAIAFMFSLEYIEQPKTLLTRFIPYLKPSGYIVFAVSNLELRRQNATEIASRTIDGQLYSYRTLMELFNEFGKVTLRPCGYFQPEECTPDSRSDIIKREFNLGENSMRSQPPNETAVFDTHSFENRIHEAQTIVGLVELDES